MQCLLVELAAIYLILGLYLLVNNIYCYLCSDFLMRALYIMQN